MPPAVRLFALLFALAAVWSGSFTLIKVAVETIPPVTATALRLLVPAALLYAILRWRGERMPRGAWLWTKIFVMGAVGNCVPFILINWGETIVDSGLAAILMGTSPLFTMTLAHFLTADERLTGGKLFGLGLGVLGLVVLIGLEALDGLGAGLLGQLAIVGAALSYALSNMVVRYLRGMSLLGMTTSVLFAAGVLALPLAVVIDRPWTLAPSGDSLLALLLIGLVSTAGGNFLYFYIIRQAGPTFVSLTNYLIPVLGVLWGALFLAEQPSWRSLAALLLILGGVMLVNTALRRERAQHAGARAVETPAPSR